MELPSEILEKLASAEQDVVDCQKLIDESRRLNATDQTFQLNMDILQRDLDARKKAIRDTKRTISILTQ